MRYALLADIHGNLPALEAVLAEIEREGIERTLLLGDYLVGPWADEVACLLQKLPGAAVAGNEDTDLIEHAKRIGWKEGVAGSRRPLAELPGQLLDGQFGAMHWLAATVSEQTLQWLAGLPNAALVPGPSAAQAIRLEHDPCALFADTAVTQIEPVRYMREADEGLFSRSGFPRQVEARLEEDLPLRERLAERPEAVFCFGHMHVQWMGHVAGKLLVAPGSLGLPLDYDRRAAWAVLEDTDGVWRAELRRTAYDAQAALEMYEASAYAKAVPVWAWVIGREMETAREVAVPFVQFALELAQRMGVEERPLPPAVWQRAFQAFKERWPHGAGAPVWIERAGEEDLGAILALQKLAYQSEAELLGDEDIPPLRQTLDEVAAELAGGVILKAVNAEGKIVGSVRGRAEGGTLYVGKLMVAPALQGRGLGGCLLAAVEKALPQPRCELFTSTLSVKNIRLYQRMGYEVFSEKQAGPGLRLVYMQKHGAAL